MISLLVYIIGQPVGWCITDKEDWDVVKIFLEKIKMKSSDSEVSVIMTDDGWSYLNKGESFW